VPFFNGKYQCMMAIMIARLTLDKAGRIVLPKPVREELQLAPGDTLELDSAQDRIILRPLRGATPLHRKQGIWVYRCDEPLPAAMVDETVRRVRQERDDENLGKTR
jgi:AbrB family looped-hinge helix DNA binding protein